MKFKNLFKIVILNFIFTINLIYSQQAGQENPASLQKISTDLISIYSTIKNVPEKIGNIKAVMSSIKDESMCLVNPRTCTRKVCNDRKECAGFILSDFVKVIDDLSKSILGNIEGKNYTMGAIAAALNIIANLIEIMPDKIKNSNTFKTKILPLAQKIKEVIIPKLGTLTTYVQNATGAINGLSFALAPDKAAANLPKEDMPPITLPDDNNNEPEFTIEE